MSPPEILMAPVVPKLDLNSQMIACKPIVILWIRTRRKGFLEFVNQVVHF